jgi:hypothetical protein
MEPERQIEKLLRAFAKKRRGQAGDTGELPAAARERLHREISRRSPGQGGGFFAGFFAGFRPRLAFAVCFAAIVGVGAWLFSPALMHPKPATLASANTELAKAPPVEQPAPAAPPPTMAPPRVASGETGGIIYEKRKALVDRDMPGQPNGTAGNRLAVVPANETPAPTSALENDAAQANSFAGLNTVSPAPADREMPANKTSAAPTVLFAGAGTLKQESADRALLASAPQINTNSILPTSTLAATELDTQKKLGLDGTPAASPASGMVFDDALKDEAATPNTVASQHFFRVNVSASRRAKETASVSAPVLTSFRVEQKGERMRIVDADGSVYTGTVLAAAEENAPASSFSGKFQNTPAAAVAKTRPPTPAGRNYFFRVAGTNRNLRQNVVFSGNLIWLTNAGVGGGTVGGQGAAAASGASPARLNSRISGKVMIGNQKEIQLDATPGP